MKNLTLLMGIILALMFVFLISVENRKDVDGYMENTYSYNSGDVIFLATYQEQELLIATDNTTEQIKAIKPIEEEYKKMHTYPDNVVKFEGETNEVCITYTPNVKEEVSCDVIKYENPKKTEEIKYSLELEKFINVNKIETKDYIILE